MKKTLDVQRSAADPLGVDCIDATTWENFDREYVERNKPVLIKGVVPEWRAFARWTPDYLKQVAGDVTVRASYRESEDELPHREVRRNAARTSWLQAISAMNPVSGAEREMLFGELVDRLTSEPCDTRYFLSHYPLERVSSELRAELDPDNWMNGGRARNAVFLGRDMFTPLHYHGAEEAFLSLIVGRKRVALFSPDQIPYLYPYPWYTPVLNLAQVDDRNPDYEKFPRFKKAKPIIVDLEAGDLLFIPLHWFHSVSAIGFTLGVTWFWRARYRNFRFPTPVIQMYANRLLAPITIGAKVRKALRYLKRKAGLGNALAPDERVSRP